MTALSRISTSPFSPSSTERKEGAGAAGLQKPFAMKKLILVLFLLVPSVGLTRAASVPYGELRPDFVARHTVNYTFETDSQSPVKNQGAIGVCHIYSLLSQFEQRYQKRTRQPIVLSSSHLLYHWWLNQIRTTFKAGKPVKEVGMGGFFEQDWALVNEYGVMPDAAFPQNPRVHMSVNYGRMDEYIRNIIDKAILTSRGLNAAAKADLEKRTTDQVRGLIRGFMGEPPATFMFAGQLLTPKTFAAKYFPEVSSTYWEYAIANKRKGAWTNLPRANGRFVAIPLNDVERVARRSLDAGFNVYLTYEHNGDFVDNKTGVMTIGGFNLPLGGGPLPRKARAKHALFDGGHAVQIVGYDVDPRTGAVVKWKIKNSWGEQAGTGGYYHMYSDYLRAFAFSVILF